jgi:hypothetical protein
MRELSVEEIREILRKPADERPKGHELEIGFTLLHWQKDKAYPPPFRSLRHFALSGLGHDRLLDAGPRDVSYPTLVRWVNVAKMLSDLDAKYQDWDLSKLVELLTLSHPDQRKRYLSQSDKDGRLQKMKVRELRDSIREFHERASQVVAEQLVDVSDRVVQRRLLREHRGWLDLVRVVRGDQERQGIYGLDINLSHSDAAAAAEFAASTLSRLEPARSKWRQVPKLLRYQRAGELSDVDRTEMEKGATKGQIVLAWGAEDEFRQWTAGSGDPPMTRSVRRVAIGDWASLKPDSPIGQIGYLVDTRSGSRKELDAVIRPTPWVGNLTVQLPSYHGPRLYEHASPEAGTPLLWEISPDGPDGSAAIALGLLQTLAEANPEMGFTATCSHRVHVSDTMLDWLARLGNAWVQHVFCGEFGKPDEGENLHRFEQLRRFRDFGVPTVALIVTRGDWPNSLLRKQAAHLLVEVDDVRKGIIIERPRSSPDAPRADGRKSRRSVPASQDAPIEADQPASSEATLPICRRGTSCSGCETLCGYHLLRRLGKLSFSRLPLT